MFCASKNHLKEIIHYEEEQHISYVSPLGNNRENVLVSLLDEASVRIDAAASTDKFI